MNSNPADSGVVLTASHVDDLLVELNGAGTAEESLEPCSEQAGIGVDRVVYGPSSTYVRLVGTAEGGDPVVLVHADGCWSRATKTTHAPAPRDDVARRGTRDQRSRSYGRVTMLLPRGAVA